jgi:hypothetical protein
MRARGADGTEVVELSPTNGSGEGGDRDARLAGDVPVSDRNEFIFAVRADQQLTTAEAMVALVIASYADLDGSNCFTAYETIAKGAKVSVRSAKRHVQTLKRYGLLDYTSGAGRGSNRYVLKVPEVPSQDVVPTIGTTSGTTDLVVPMDGTTNPASGDTPGASGARRDATCGQPDTPAPLHGARP